jgi:hypothetical protein
MTNILHACFGFFPWIALKNLFPQGQIVTSGTHLSIVDLQIWGSNFFGWIIFNDKQKIIIKIAKYVCMYYCSPEIV